MARNRTVYVIFLLACVIFSAAYRSRISAVLLIAALAYPLVALALTAISLYTLSVRFAEKRAVHEKNEQFELPLMLHNHFIFPYAPAELDCLLPDNDTGLFLHKQVYVCVSPLKNMRIFVPCMHRYRGSYTAQIMRMSVYDPLKIIRLTRRLEAAQQLIILPRKILLEDLGIVSGGDNGAAPEQRRSTDREDLSHVREYMEGDTVQLIHWKLTAKLDEMMVKQFDCTGDRRSFLLCDFSFADSTASAMIRRSDAVAEAAIAVAMSCCRSGVRLTADTGAFSEGSCDIADEAGFGRFYEMMSVLPPYIDTMEFTELIHRYSVGGTSAMFMITSTLSEDILAAAEAAAERISGAAVLIYVNCNGRSDYPERDENSRFVFAEVSGDSEEALSAAAEQIISDCIRLK